MNQTDNETETPTDRRTGSPAGHRTDGATDVDTAGRAIHLEALGTRFAIEVPDARQREVLAREWSRCVVAPDGRTAEPLSITPGYSDEEAGYALASEITMKCIHQLRGRSFMLHACGLADSRGRVLALVAGSGTGKTTAAITLGRAGLGYVTDETVAISPSGAVLPYPKPLSLVDDELAGGPKLQHGPDDLGLGRPPQDLRLGRVVLLQRGPGHEGRPALEALPLIDGLLELMPQTSSLSRLDRPLQTACRLIADAGGLHRLTYSEIADAAELLGDLLSRGTTPADAPEWEPFTDGVAGADDMRWAMLDHRVRLRPHTDAVLVGDEVLIMISDIPIRLRGLGLTIWQACRDAPTVEEIEQIVTEVHGPHPDSTRIIAETLAELEEAAVIAWGRPRPVAELVPPRGE